MTDPANPIQSVWTSSGATTEGAALGAMASWLTGEAPNLQPTPAEQAERLRRVVGMLRAFPEDPAAQWAADGFDAWLANGGDLQRTMGLRPRRGGAHDLPHRAGRLQARDKALCDLAATLTAPDRAQALASMVKADHPAVRVIRQAAGAVPASKAQLQRILRSQARG
jgi:hypothetical protein